METKHIVSIILFFLSTVSALISWTYHDWIHTGADAGSFVFGLTKQCQTIFGRQPMCFSASLPAEWMATLIFLILATMLLAATCGLIMLSRWNRRALYYAQWLSFGAVTCLCFVGLLFPIGFRQTAVGGEAFKLPDMWQFGESYKVFWPFAVALSCCGWCSLKWPAYWRIGNQL